MPAPAAITAPVLSIAFGGDTPRVGVTLTATTGSWANSPTTYLYEWRSGGVTVPGETTSLYRIRSGDAGKQIVARVYASNLSGTGGPNVSNGLTVVPLSGYSTTVIGTAGLIGFWQIGTGVVDLKPGGGQEVALRAYPLAHRPLTGWPGASGESSAGFSAALADKEESFAAVSFETYSGAYSIELLAYCPTGSFTTQPMGLFATDDADLHYGPNIWLDAGATSMPIRINYGNGTAIYTPALSATFTRDAWHHIVMAVGADGSWEFFLDGVSKGSGTWSLTGTPKLTKYDTDVPTEDENILYLGTMSGPTGGSTDNWNMFNGRLMHWAVYNTKLSPATVTAHYGAAAGGLSPFHSYTFLSSGTAPVSRGFRAYTWTDSVTLKASKLLAGTTDGASSDSGMLGTAFGVKLLDALSAGASVTTADLLRIPLPRHPVWIRTTDGWMLLSPAVGYFTSATHAAGSTITLPRATHQLHATRGLMVTVHDETTGAQEVADVTVGANGDVGVSFTTSAPANSKRVTVIGPYT